MFTGPFPVKLCQLENLRYLSVSVNELSGHIPREIGNLNELHFL